MGRSERRHWGELWRPWPAAGRGTKIDRADRLLRLPDGNVQAMQQFVGQSPWEWQEVCGAIGKADYFCTESGSDCCVRWWTIPGFPNKARSHGGRGSTVIPDTGQDRQLPGSGESAPCGRAGEYGSGLAIVSAGVLDQRPGEAPGGWGSEEVVFQKKWNWHWIFMSIKHEVRGLPDRGVLGDAGYVRGHGVSRGVGSSEACATPWASRSA